MIYRYNTAEKNGKLYITGWASEEDTPDNINTFAEPCDMEEPWQYILGELPDGTRRKVFDPIQLTAAEKEAKRTAEVDQQIRAKLPELMRIIAADDLKGFDELKAEIRTIDQSIKVVQRK